jgi:hypothetical protein
MTGLRGNDLFHRSDGPVCHEPTRRHYMGLESRVPLLLVVRSPLYYCQALTPCTVAVG